MLATKVKAELDTKRDAAKAAWAEFDGARKAAVENGLDPSKDKAAFDTLHEKHRSYATIADEVAVMEDNYVKALEMDGVKSPSTPLDAHEVAKNIAGLMGERKTTGQRVIESKEYESLRESGALELEGSKFAMTPFKAFTREQFKTLLQTGSPTATSTGAGPLFNLPDRQPGFVELLQAPIQIIDLVSHSETDSASVEWIKQTAVASAAAEVAEATATSGSTGTKPESAMTFSLQNSPVQNIAHWIPATRSALADTPQLAGLIDTQLVDGVRRRLNGQLLNGNGTAPNLRGILNTSGIGAITLQTVPFEGVLKAMTTIRLAFLDPRAILMHPSDFESVRLEKDANGNYLFGPPALAGSTTLWGLPVIQDTNIAAGSALVADFSQAVLYHRSGIDVYATDSHQDFFIRNMVVVLAEGRWALAVPRPEAFCTVALA